MQGNGFLTVYEIACITEEKFSREVAGICFIFVGRKSGS